MDNELWSSIKNTVKNMFKIKRNFIILIIIIILLPLLLGAFVYYIDVDNGTNKADDPSSVGGAVTRNNGSANIALQDGHLSTTKTAQELWDELIKNGSDVNDYLKSPEELAKLMKAEIVTQYPDTRKNPDEKINWDELLKPDSKDAYGIIKLNRTLLGEKIDVSDAEIKNLDKEYEKYKEDIERKQKERKEKEEKEKNKKEKDKKDKDKKEENKELEKLMSKDEWMKNKGFTINNGKWQKDKTIRMTYTDPETFDNKMKQYRKTGSEADKKEAMKYFTLEKSNLTKGYSRIDTIESLDKVLFLGDSHTVDLEKSSDKEIKEKTKNSIFKAEVGVDAQYWIDNFNKLPNDNDINTVCVMLGVNNHNVLAMKTLINKLVNKYPEKNIYIQKVFPVAKKWKEAEILNERLTQFNYDIEEYCNQKEKVFFIDTTTGYVDEYGFLKENLTKDGLHFEDKKKWLENIEQNIVNHEVSTDIKNNKDDKKEKDNKKDKDDKKEKNSKNKKVSLENLPNFNNEDAYKTKNPYYSVYTGQCTWFAWGLFYEMYGFSPGFRGDGGTWVNQLLSVHGDKFEKGELGSLPVPGAVFSSTNTGNEYGHVGIVLDVDGNSVTIAEGNYATVPWNYPSNIPIGTTTQCGWKKSTVDISYLNGRATTYANPKDGFRPSSSGSTKVPAPYYIKVATWSETQSQLTGDDAGGKVSANPTIHEMTETRINYYDMVRGYTMPFDYLWALMVITEDKDFVMGLADLVYNSDIEITVNDNKTITTTTENYEFDKMMDVFETAKIGLKNKDDKGDSNENKPINRPPKGGYDVMEMSNMIYDNNVTLNNNYYKVDNMMNLPKISEKKLNNETEFVQIIEKTKEGKGIKQGTNTAKLVTTITSNTVDAGVTRANTWIVDYTKGYKITKEESNSGDDKKIERKDLNDNPEKMKYGNPDNRDMLNFRSELQGQEVVSIESKYKEYTTNWTLKTNTHTDTTKFVETTPYVREKISKKKKAKEELKDKKDFKYKEKNFVTLLVSNQKAYGNIFSVDSWLFEILEANDSTKETMVDLTKYLLYRTKDRDDWNVTEFDFSIFEPGKFTQIDDSGSSGTASTDLISFIGSYEGDPHKIGEDYKIFFTEIDGCYNIGHGVVVRDGNGKVYYPDIIPNPQIGQIVPKSVYEKLFKNKIKGYMDDVDRALAKYGVTFNQHQYDATVSFIYNCGTNGGKYTDMIVSEYKKKGNQGFRDYTKQFVNTKSGYSQGLANRRLDEYELFKDGDYKRDH